MNNLEFTAGNKAESGFEYDPNLMTSRDLEGSSKGAKERRRIFYEAEVQARVLNNDVPLPWRE